MKRKYLLKKISDPNSLIRSDIEDIVNDARTASDLSCNLQARIDSYRGVLLRLNDLDLDEYETLT